MSNVLNFKNWVRVNEARKTQGIFEQVAITAVSLDKHPDCIAMGKAVAAAGGGKLPYDQVVEYAGKQLYCKLEKKSENTEAGSASYNSAQLTFNVYCIGTSKSSWPTPIYLGSCYVDRTGKVSPQMDASGKGVSVSDNSLTNRNDDTGIGFKGFDSSFWDPYATNTFLQYVNTICANAAYLKKVFWSIRKDPAEWQKQTKPTKGMASLMQKVGDAAIAAV